jgi:hypothetical protein
VFPAGTGSGERRHRRAQSGHVTTGAQDGAVGADDRGSRVTLAEPLVQDAPAVDGDYDAATLLHLGALGGVRLVGCDEREPACGHVVEAAAVPERGVRAESAGQRAAQPRPPHQTGTVQRRRLAVEDVVLDPWEQVQPGCEDPA